MAKSIEDDKEYQKLKDTHKQFITNMLQGKSATESYALAFPNASRQTAGVKGHKLKTQYETILARHNPINPDMVQRIAEETIANLTLMAFADTGDMIDKNGKPLPIHKIPKSLRMGITEIEVRGNKMSYKIGGKLKALEILSKFAKLTDATPEISVTIMTEEEKNARIKEILVQASRRNDDDTE